MTEEKDEERGSVGFLSLRPPAQSPVTVFASPYNLLTQEPGFVRFVRTREAYPELAVLEEEFHALRQVLEPSRRAQLRCLRDLRLARGNNDPRFEAQLKATRLQLFRGWDRLVVLMQSPTGVLQGQRVLRDIGVDALVTTKETEALAYLCA